MTAPAQIFRRQGQFYKCSGAGNQAAYDGAYAAEKFAFVNAATGADRQIVAAVTGKKIRVISYSVSGPAGSVATATFKSATTAISPLISLAANGFAAEASDSGLFQTADAEALQVATSATCGVRVTYVEVD